MTSSLEVENLIILIGQEGVGKSTIAKAIVLYLERGTAFDTEDLLQVNPFTTGIED